MARKLSITKHHDEVAKLLAKYNRDRAETDRPSTTVAILKQAVGLGLDKLLSENKGAARKFVQEAMRPKPKR